MVINFFFFYFYIFYLDVIKSCEQKYQIVTQDLKLSNVIQITNFKKHETLRNIVAKTNIKLGGLNYSIMVQPEE